MEKMQDTQVRQSKISRLIAVITLAIMSLMVSSCSVIGDIFKAGMGFGIFIVVAIIVVIIIVFLRFSKK